MSGARRSCTPWSRPFPPWPTLAPTPSWSPTPPAAAGSSDLGIQLAHSDADPAVLAHLAGELADTTPSSDGRGWTPPIPLQGYECGARVPCHDACPVG